MTAFSDIPGQDNLPLLTCLEKHVFSVSVFNRCVLPVLVMLVMLWD